MMGVEARIGVTWGPGETLLLEKKGAVKVYPLFNSQALRFKGNEK